MGYFLILVPMVHYCRHRLWIKTYICFNSMNTWIERVDFQELLLTGLEKPFLKLGKVSLHCVFICNWRKKEERREELWTTQMTQVYSLKGAMTFRGTAKTCAVLIITERRTKICVLTPYVEKNPGNTLSCSKLHICIHAYEGKGGKN